MVQTTVSTGAFDRIQRARLLHHENLATIPFGIPAKLAELTLGDIATLATKREPILHGLNRFGESQSLFPFRLEQVKCQPLCAFLTDPWQTH